MDSGDDGDPQQLADNTGRIPKSVANGTVIFLYALALLSAFLRTVIRLRHRRLQWLDDGFLLTAVTLMTVAFGIYFSFIDDVYVTELFIYNPFAAGTLLVEAISIGERVQTYTIPYIILSLSGIFAVKFSFLFFFRNILSRIRPLILYWRVVVAYTAVVWAFSVGFSVYGCPYVDDRALSCAQGPELWRAIDASVGLIVCDVSSDVLIVTIPILVLREIRLPWRKKIYLAASLCVSLVMVAVAILQAATLTYAGVAAIDVVWQIYFQFCELCIAVVVVSSTAFRALFVQQRGEGSDPTPRSPGWYKYKTYKKAWHKLWSSSAESEPPRLDQTIPHAEMTGMQTYIDRGAGSPWPDSGSDGAQEVRLARPPKARREPSGMVGSMLSPEEEYHRIQRNMLRNSPTSEISAVEAGDGSSAQAVTPVSDSASYEADPEKGLPSPMSPEHRRRSHVGPLRPADDKPAEHSNTPAPELGNAPTPEPGVSPIEGSDYFVGSAGPSWKPSANPSAHTSRRPSRPDAGAESSRQLPPTPPLEPVSRVEQLHNDPQAPAAAARRPSRTLRPVGDEPMRESGLKRAIKDSLEMASDFRPGDSESWFSDK